MDGPPITGSDHRTKGARVRTEALTQCWFTRVHRPVRERHRDADGSLTSTCRYCHRPLVSWDHANWNLANGFDVSRLVELTSGRTLTLIDTTGDLIVRRIPIRHLQTEDEVDAFKRELRAQYGLDDPDSTLDLRDSAPRQSRRARSKPSDIAPLPGGPLPDPA
jgi:hypothetical protein